MRQDLSWKRKLRIREMARHTQLSLASDTGLLRATDLTHDPGVVA